MLPLLRYFDLSTGPVLEIMRRPSRFGTNLFVEGGGFIMSAVMSFGLWRICCVDGYYGSFSSLEFVLGFLLFSVMSFCSIWSSSLGI